MTSCLRAPLFAMTLTALLGLTYISTSASSEGGDELPAVVKKIAASIKKGDVDGARKLAKATAANPKLIEEIPDLMHMYRPTDKGGLGIEKALKKTTAKEADELGNQVIAMAELTLAKGWPKDQGKRTKKAWNEFTEEMRAAAQDLAKAKNDKAAYAAATKVNNACTRCHTVFKD
jgi:hypothetical protein